MTEHYKTLDLEASATPTVTEFFSFYCPHCYNFEPVINTIKGNLPESASFEKVHTLFMGGSMSEAMAKAYATMFTLGVEESMVPAMFKQIHQLRGAPQDEQALRRVFIDNGTDAKKFDATYHGFVVNSMVRSFDKHFKESGLEGVPAVVVNQKYLVVPVNIRSMEEYSEVVNSLLTKT